MKKMFLLALAGVLSLLLSSAPSHGADVEAGKFFFERKGCGSCHTTSGPEARIPPPARHGIKGPTLWFAGSKFRPGYLAKWLAEPEPFRGVIYGTMKRGRYPHPALSAKDAAKVAAYLESLKDPQMPVGVVPRWKKIPRKVLRRARILFQKKQPCYSCHMVAIRKTVYRAKIEVGGHSAPHFKKAGHRLNPDFIVAFLKKPARYNPNGRMPVYGDKPFTKLSEKDFLALAAYIASFK
ncbi:MAG: c-type cytochrome [Nitrospinae bacterium]|nr:c-type cytochrome [Nitrospinota bacterium]